MIVMGATVPPFKMNNPGCWGSWLTHADTLTAAGVTVFAALETDARGLEPFRPLLDRLTSLRGVVWTFHVDDGAPRITGGNRLLRICTGRNLISAYAMVAGASHVLFADADTVIPADAPSKLLEVNWPVVGGRVPSYGLHGPRVPGYDFPVAEHMNTAGFLLVERRAFTRLSWRVDLDAGLTDDPCYHADASALGWPTRVREDCVAAHYPPVFGPVETRGHDMTVYR